MQDQDIINEEERHEAATEEPTTLGRPSLVPGAIPSGADGTEPAEPDKAEELKRRGAKIKACNDRSYAKMVRIAELANECVQRTTHDAYMPGQYGRDYLAFGKAICEIRQICKHGLCGDFPDYEWMAGMMTSEHFDPNRLAQEIEAKASEKPVDYPTFYTPGWLVDLAKRLQGKDKGVKTAEFMRRKYSFCDGLFPIRRANCEKGVVEHCWIGGRRFTMELSQDIHDDGEHVCCAKIRDNGKTIARLVFYRGKSMAEHMAHAAYKSYVKNLSGSNRLSSRGGFLKAAIKRRAAAKQQAHDNKAAAVEVK